MQNTISFFESSIEGADLHRKIVVANETTSHNFDCYLDMTGENAGQ